MKPQNTEKYSYIKLNEDEYHYLLGLVEYVENSERSDFEGHVEEGFKPEDHVYHHCEVLSKLLDQVSFK